MKKIFIAIVLALTALNGTAYAISCPDSLGVTFPPNQKAKLCTYFLNTASLTGSLTFAGAGPLIAPTSFGLAIGAATTPNYTIDNVKVVLPSSGVVAASTAIALSVGAANTPNVTFNTSGMTFANNGQDVVYPAAAVITPSTGVPTPAAGNTLTNRYTILAAGAPTAAFVVLPVATTSVGKTFSVFNQGSNPLAIVPQTGVINVSAALTPFSCTTLKECQCKGLTTGVFGCSQQ